jgi:hypothetical protein
MNTLTWLHTRTGKPKYLSGALSTLIFRASAIRSVSPQHAIYLNGVPL